MPSKFKYVRLHKKRKKILASFDMCAVIKYNNGNTSMLMVLHVVLIAFVVCGKTVSRCVCTTIAIVITITVLCLLTAIIMPVCYGE